MPLTVVAGDCTVRERDGSDSPRELRGRVVVVVKPDDTVLVHDADGYQPVAWLTRADGVAWERAPDAATATTDALAPAESAPSAAGTPDTTGSGGPASAAAECDPAFSLTARKDRRVLVVTAHEERAFVSHDATAAGTPVGDCRCDGPLVRADGGVRCLDCGEQYGLPRDAAVLGVRCDCGLPQFAVERGRRFELCLDRGCAHARSMDEAVRAAFDGEWDCPDCGAALRVLRRGGLLLGCERYPDCEVGYAVPTGTVTAECDCGLPVFETGAGRRCLDSTCDRPLPAADQSTLAAAGADPGEEG
jgi:DNA topoisomerase-1